MKQTGKAGQKIVTYFMSSEDANDFLSEMSQANCQQLGEFRVTAVSMEKILKQIEEKKQSRKMGRYDMDLILRIQVFTEATLCLLNCIKKIYMS
jgi:hypothetical protein